MDFYSHLTDDELVKMYANGSNEAFDSLLSRYKNKLFSYIFYTVHDEDMANDIFQETFVKVITKLHQGKYVNSGKFSAWLMRIAHNVIMDWYRDHRTENIVEPNEENDLSNISSRDLMEANVENQYVNTQVMNDVTRMMNQLPPTQREVVYMRFYQDMSFKEIAETTGVSINTSLGRMRYAVMNMRKMAREHQIMLQLEM